jgi:hypothetical protein
MITRETLLRIAAIAGDERADPATRDIAWRKLEDFKEQYPDLFVIEPPDDGFAKVEVEEAEVDPAFEDYRNWANWEVSAKGNPWRELSDCTVTIFPDRFHEGQFRWCVAWSAQEKPTYSRDRFPHQQSAKIDAWWTEIAPKRRGRRT